MRSVSSDAVATHIVISIGKSKYKTILAHENSTWLSAECHESIGKHENQEDSTLTSARLYKYFAPAVFGVASIRGSDRDDWPCKWTSMDSATSEQCVDESRQVVNELYGYLSKIDDSELDFGDRMNVMASVLENTIEKHTELFCDSIRRVLSANTSNISEATRSAAIRYLGVYESAISSSDLTNLFVESLSSSCVSESIAAARSLSETADAGAISAIRLAARRATNPSIRGEIEKAVKRLEATHGLRPTS